MTEQENMKAELEALRTIVGEVAMAMSGMCEPHQLMDPMAIVVARIRKAYEDSLVFDNGRKQFCISFEAFNESEMHNAVDDAFEASKPHIAISEDWWV